MTFFQRSFPEIGKPISLLSCFLAVVLLTGIVLVVQTTLLGPAPGAMPPRTYWGYIDKTGKWVIPAKYDSAYAFHDGVAKVISRGRVLFLDRSGKELALSDTGLSDPPFQESMALVKTGVGQCYFVDRSGKKIFPQVFEDAFQFREGTAAVKTGGKWGYINAQGRLVIPAQFEQASQFSEGTAVVALVKDKKWEYIDKSGKVVIPPEKLDNLRYPGSFKEGMAQVVRADMKTGFINRQGNVVIAPQLAIAGDFQEGLVYAVQRWPLEKGAASDKYGYMDKAGHFAISPRFSSASSFQEGLAVVQPEYNGLWGYIDHTGKFAIAPKYRDAHEFHEGLAVVLDDQGWAFIDKSGKAVLRPDCFSQPGEFSEGLAPSNLIAPENNR